MTNRLHPTRKLMRVKTASFVAGAVWMKIHARWSCIRAARAIRWMRGLNSIEARRGIDRINARYEWLPFTADNQKKHLPSNKGRPGAHTSKAQKALGLTCSPCGPTGDQTPKKPSPATPLNPEHSL